MCPKSKELCISTSSRMYLMQPSTTITVLKLIFIFTGHEIHEMTGNGFKSHRLQVWQFSVGFRKAHIISRSHPTTSWLRHCLWLCGSLPAWCSKKSSGRWEARCLPVGCSGGWSGHQLLCPGTAARLLVRWTLSARDWRDVRALFSQYLSGLN